MEMVQRRPHNHAELRRITGIGERKLGLYGDQFLAVIREHEGAGGSGEVLDMPTADDSLVLYRLGMGVEQIAEQRGLKPATIYSHLARAIARGLADAAEVVGLGRDEAARIEAVWRGLPEENRAGLKPLYEALAGQYSYDVLRCLRASWRDFTVDSDA
jgi:ATP-dependent DNA helicase RecQ